ncbi:NAD-dependent epimerase/dehydratase family protein [Glycomyces buryatensis]|uniref:NAD-dependent epimerase/dehydratase family protein n=1 Tax=Glycomyces buryatensis TaxID=2570927 RepID=UPI0014562F17|nr:NAD(P)-dependent oxidoreductase [Glycomyces buryatensis]
MEAARVLVTGGAGQLGRVLQRSAAAGGTRMTLYDVADGVNVVRGDVNDGPGLRDCMLGCDTVVHAASLHGVHLNRYPVREFMRVNVQGTESVLRNAAKAGIRHVVLISSTSVYGLSSSLPFTSTAWADEETPVRPTDSNDLCKVLCEQLSEYAVRRYGISVTVLRPGRFWVGDVASFNLAKLSGAVDVSDVAHAALQAVAAGGEGFQVYCVASKTRFDRGDLDDLETRADRLIEERYPGAGEALARHGLELPRRLHRVVCIAKAQKELGYEPRVNFEQFLESGSDAAADGAAIAETAVPR